MTVYRCCLFNVSAMSYFITHTNSHTHEVRRITMVILFGLWFKSLVYASKRREPKKAVLVRVRFGVQMVARVETYEGEQYVDRRWTEQCCPRRSVVFRSTCC